ncbi:hypothetical protein OG455_07525 [Kitasatospora sp. NBC_01287]|uniref:hypothetical protein n=1 Tax=Kitasatospora sp. NBC_01287 TaxID=2903573 RepID=UPI0022549F94|nr:hypothetical protein [Kitasatospora sp. NBC_01287]MCX4745375.1 hypothetical protein [Kitasatospora sp. NBC_01287]
MVEGRSPDLAAMFRHFQQVGLDVDVEGLRREHPEVGWHTMERWAAERSWDLAGPQAADSMTSVRR